MPIYKVDGVKKDGLQKYNVRINYISDSGEARQLTRTAYGLEAAKDLERKLTAEQKNKGGEVPTRKMTIQQLFDEYIAAKEVKDTSREKCRWNIEYYILPTFKDVRLDRLNVQALQEWKLSMGQKLSFKQTKLSLNTKKHAYSEFRAMLNYAVKMEYIPKNPLLKIENFRDSASIGQEMDFYTAQEFKQLISAAKKPQRKKKQGIKSFRNGIFMYSLILRFIRGLERAKSTH